MLKYSFSLEEESRAIESAVEKVLEKGKIRTPDIGGTDSTSELGDAIVRTL
ncbi:MAG: isocitrate/isopropylmalate family dehydrogenase [Deltaproteobacteria bacterium]